MKFSIPITCDDCGEFLVDVNGTQLPKDAKCPKCRKTIWLVEPLGNIVGMAIMHRAATELIGGDSTLTIVLAAMAVESQLAYLFMKWNRLDLTLQRNPTDADEEEWEERWRDIRSVAARFDRVSSLLAGQSFDSFLSANGELLKSVRTQYQSSGEASAKNFFVKGLFQKRNRVVHFGKIDFQQSDAELCFALATALWHILVGMDAHCYRKLQPKWS
ncbi:MAG TPA: hypothetical protein VEI26_05075 [Terriglobales bacterium]|nr:hypothetical protein [Terriglobales bacterium]